MEDKLDRVLKDIKTFSEEEKLELWDRVTGSSWLPLVKELKEKDIGSADVRAVFEQYEDEISRFLKERKIDKAMRSARASLEVEGFKVTQEMDNLVKRRQLGEISEEQFMEEALRSALSKKDPEHE